MEPLSTPLTAIDLNFGEKELISMLQPLIFPNTFVAGIREVSASQASLMCDQVCHANNIKQALLGRLPKS